MSSSQLMAPGGGALGSAASAEAAETAETSQRRFVAGFLGSFLAVLAAVFALFEKCVLASCHLRIQYNADGSLTKQSLRYLPEDAKSLRRSVRARIALVRAHPETLRQARRDLEDPTRFSYMERMLAFMNGRGEVPVIVLNPIYPSVYALQRKMGFPELRATLWKIRQLRKMGYRFVFVNCEDMRAWHGTSKDWSNASHVNRANMRRELRYIVAHSDGVLR